jgi:hypothetical protein
VQDKSALYARLYANHTQSTQSAVYSIQGCDGMHILFKTLFQGSAQSIHANNLVYYVFFSEFLFYNKLHPEIESGLLWQPFGIYPFNPL